jgi:hypothetical protein
MRFIVGEMRHAVLSLDSLRFKVSYICLCPEQYLVRMHLPSKPAFCDLASDCH